MTPKELKRLRRTDLLEMLLDSVKQLESVQDRLAEAEAKLAQRQIAIDESGSIAEASLKLNGVFDAAQKAAEQYLEVLRERSEQAERQCREQEEQSRQLASQIVEDARKQAEAILAEAAKKAEEMTAQTMPPEAPEEIQPTPADDTQD